MSRQTVDLPHSFEAYAPIGGGYVPATAVAFLIDSDDGEATDFVVVAEVDGDIVPCVVPFLRPAPTRPEDTDPGPVIAPTEH